MNTLQQPIAARLDAARQFAQEAGRHTLKYYLNDNFQVQRKSDDSPVTIADREAEQLLRKRISEQFPDDAILGEEFGEQPGSSGIRWILDPIDGTKSFIHGIPLYTTLIGLEAGQRSVAGVIYAPATRELAYAQQGSGAWYCREDQPPERMQVSRIDSLEQALLLTSEVVSFSRHRETDAMGSFLKLQETARLSRTWGDAYGYLMVAAGRADVMIDPIMNVWDAAPLQPILEEAGGAFTDWKGNPTIYGGESVGSNRLLHEQVLAVTREA